MRGRCGATDGGGGWTPRRRAGGALGCWAGEGGGPAGRWYERMAGKQLVRRPNAGKRPDQARWGKAKVAARCSGGGRRGGCRAGPAVA
ncbi:hypothetical protein WJX79_002923 [Trebouxia sp. C0005]